MSVILNMKIMYFCPCLHGNALSSKDSLGQIAKAFHLTLSWHICMFFSSVQQILSAEEHFSNDPWALLYQHTVTLAVIWIILENSFECLRLTCSW